MAALPAIVAPDDVGAYDGAPWFRPSHPYDSNFPDPSIVVGDGIYYAYGGTTGGAYLPVMTSTDLQTWTARPAYDPGPPSNDDPFFNDALPHPASWGVDRPVGGRLTKEVWAPGAARIGGRWLVFHAVRTRLDRDRFCITVSSSDSPLGPFTDTTDAPLVCDADPNGSIDPQPFVDSDGTPHLLWKSEGVPGSQPTRLWSRRLTASGMAFAPGSTASTLLETSQGWEGNVIENPSMVRHGGRLYLFYSANEYRSDRYAIGYARCAGPAGPCTKAADNPLLASTGDRLGPGGPAAFVDLDGRLRMAYHWWNAPYTSYPSDPGCDGIDPSTGAPWCVSQGQRRMSITTVTPTSDTLTVGGSGLPSTPTTRSLDDACPDDRVPDAPFGDVDPAGVHGPAIGCVHWWGVAEGTGPGRFDPARSVTRGQMASFIARTLDQTNATLADEPPNAFPDDDGTNHAHRVDQLAAAGVVEGRADGTYGPDDPVTRAQMATFLARAAALAGVEVPAGADAFADDGGQVHAPNIDAMAGVGVVGGLADGTYGPHRAVSRAQMGSFLARLLDLLVAEGQASLPD